MNADYQLLMIRPCSFGYNEQTAVNNAFQNKPSQEGGIQEKALAEFDRLVTLLKAHQIEVFVIEDTLIPMTPDSIFPNNWISFHAEKTAILYPLFAPNRREERKVGVIKSLTDAFQIKRLLNWTQYEHDGNYLEGTGSLVLDRERQIAYACLSPRTSHMLVQKFCREMNYRPVIFEAEDENGLAIYHTNVMMCVGNTFAVACLECIPDVNDRSMLVTELENSGKEIIEISFAQMKHFAGNMLQVQNKLAKKYLVMSTRAYQSLDRQQIDRLNHHNEIVHADLATIEHYGGGGARCMLAEINRC